MKRLKKWIQLMRDHDMELQERMFRLLVMIGLLGLAGAILNGIVIGESKENIIPLVVAFVIFACITYFSIRFRKIQTGAVIIGAIIIYVVLPFNFLTTGGLYGGAPIYFLFGMVYMCLVVRGKVKYVFMVSGLMVDVVCYFIAYAYPGLTVQHTLDMAYIDSLMSLLIVGVWVCSMILFQNAIFRAENATVEKQKEEIEELNRAQNRFFSSMSHEIRTPINTIIGLNEMILREDISEEVAADAVSMQGASRMLLSLINDFLDMSKIESGKMDIVPVTYDVGAMLSDIVNSVWVRAKEKGLEFHVDVDRAVPAQLIGDEVRVKQVLINVLNNAVKYTQTGSVTLSIQSKEQKEDSVLVSYSISDTGMGIKKESIPYLFSAFKRVDEEKSSYIEGTGLGLAIVKQLVELMGGDIAVNSVYTKGSTFMITLPQKVAGEEKIGKFSLESRHIPGTREHYKQSFEAPEAHVLVVDDNAANLVVAERLLRDTKVQVDTVMSGAECLEKTLKNRYDVILMDHLMPGMDGIECLHAIRMQTEGPSQNVRVVALTANAGSENRALYRREGFDGYLTKPVDGTKLEAELLRQLPKELVSMTETDTSVGVTETPILEYRRKLSVMVSTDSVCDLPKSLVEKYRIAVMPYRVLTDGGEFQDGIEAETDGILSYMGGKEKHAKSESPETAAYEEFFAEQLTKAQYIVHITMAKNVSLGYANASEAAKTFDNVIVVDSGHLSSGMGLMVLQAAKYAADGLSANSIARAVEGMRGRVRTSFIVDSTEYLARSGRLAANVNVLCKALMLHPVLVLKNSSMKVGAIRIGAKERVRKKYIRATLNTRRTVDKRTLFVTYAGLSNEELKDIAAQVKKKVKFDTVIFQKASPAISTNCGPGTFGLLFMTK